MHAIVETGRPPVPLPLAEFLFDTADVSTSIDTTRWARFFDEIPADPYVPEGYRYKAVAWLRVKHAQAPSNPAIDDHIARANEASGMSPERSRALQSGGPPTWVSRETGYACWKLP